MYNERTIQNRAGLAATRLQIWEIRLENRWTHKRGIPIKSLSVSSLLHHHVSCMLHPLKNRICPTFEESSIMSKHTFFCYHAEQLWPQSVILTFLKVEQTKQEEKVTLYHPCVFSHSLSNLIFPFGTFLFPGFLYALQSHFKIICSHYYTPLSTNRRQLLSGAGGLYSWPQFNTVDFLNKVSFNET